MDLLCISMSAVFAHGGDAKVRWGQAYTFRLLNKKPVKVVILINPATIVIFVRLVITVNCFFVAITQLRIYRCCSRCVPHLTYSNCKCSYPSSMSRSLHGIPAIVTILTNSAGITSCLFYFNHLLDYFTVNLYEVYTRLQVVVGDLATRDIKEAVNPVIRQPDLTSDHRWKNGF